MKGDFTRSTFQKQKHYSSVRMQQGRLQLDADWNEQVDIQNYLMQTQVQDVIGLSGIPNAEDNKDAFKITPDGKDFKITRGRIYVDGILCELEADATYTKQTLYPNAAIADKIVGENGEIQSGRYLVYLDVWQRHITAIEDPEIREIALNGADTATRTQTVAQVKLAPLENHNKWQTFLSNKQRRTAGIKASKAPNSSIVDNNLYRIEIHQSGIIGEATFKWARNNATIVSEIESIKGNIITISPKNYEMWQSSQPDQWIEIIDEARELTGKPGTLVRLEQVFDNKLVCDISRVFDAPKKPLLEDTEDSETRKLRVRRWDYTSDTTDTTNSGGIPTTLQWLQLGDEGIQIKFGKDKDEDKEPFYETGDYWLVPTRAITNTIEWFRNQNNSDPASKSYEGINHHYCGLAILNYQGGRFDNKTDPNSDKIDPNSDLRKLFLPLTQDAASAGNIGLNANQKRAALHVQGATSADSKGKISPFPAQNSPEPGSDIQILQVQDISPDLLQVGDTIIADGLTTAITEISSLARLKVYPALRIQANTPFSYQQPIARFSRLENDQDKTEVIISAQGRVGIGTAAPRARLTVQGQADQSAIARFLDSKSSTHLIVAADGKVGIGTETPTEALQVRGTIETDNLKLPPQGTFEVGTLKARTVQLQDQSELPYGTIQTANIDGSKQIQFTANSGQNVEFGFIGNVRIASPNSNTPAFLTIDGSVDATRMVRATGFEGNSFQFTQGSTTLSSRARGGLSINNDVVIEKPGDATVTLFVDGQVNATVLNVTNTSTTEALVINRSLKFSSGPTITQISTDSTFENASHQTLVTQLAIKTYVNASLDQLNETVNMRAPLNGSDQADFNVQNLTVNGVLKLLRGVEVNEFSTSGELREISTAVPTEQAVKAYVDTRLAASLPRPDNLSPNSGGRSGSGEVDFTAKTLTIAGNLVTTPATELQPGELARLYVQGKSANPANFSSVGPSIVRSSADLHVGDTIRIANHPPKLITHATGSRAEGFAFSVTPQFDTIPTANTLQYKQPTARFVNSTGENQLTITAEGLVVIGSFDRGHPIQLSTPLLETKLYVNGHIFGRDVRGNIQQISSRDLKEDITELSSQEVSQLLEALNPIKFTYTADTDKKVRVGFISEDAPDLVASMDKKSISPLDVVAVLTKAVQDQRQTTITLSHFVDRQQQEIISLQEQVKMLEQKATRKSWIG